MATNGGRGRGMAPRDDRLGRLAAMTQGRAVVPAGGQRGLADLAPGTRAAMRAMVMAGGALDERGAHDAGIAAGPGDAPSPEATNLPAVISRAIDASGEGFVPRWHMVRDMPRMVQEPIRQLAGAVFAQFTDTPIGDLQMVSTLNSPESEVRALMAWIRHNGERDDETVIDFEASLPGYRAEAQLWSAEDYSFLLVRDMQGHYVYGWPGGRDLRLDDEPPALPGPR